MQIVIINSCKTLNIQFSNFSSAESNLFKIRKCKCQTFCKKRKEKLQHNTQLVYANKDNFSTKMGCLNMYIYKSKNFQYVMQN